MAAEDGRKRPDCGGGAVVGAFGEVVVALESVSGRAGDEPDGDAAAPATVEDRDAEVSDLLRADAPVHPANSMAAANDRARTGMVPLLMVLLGCRRGVLMIRKGAGRWGPIQIIIASKRP